MSVVTVLYIDDDKAIARMMIEVLTALGLKVHSALTTAEADDILKKEKVDVICCDIQMEPEDGLTYCRRIHSTGPHAPLILLSAGIDAETTAAAQKAGAADCLSKPFDIMEVHRRIVEVAKARS